MCIRNGRRKRSAFPDPPGPSGPGRPTTGCVSSSRSTSVIAYGVNRRPARHAVSRSAAVGAGRSIARSARTTKAISISIPVDTPEFAEAHVFGTVRFVLDIWERYFGRRIEWHFARDYRRLEIVILPGLNNAYAGYGFMEVGAHHSPDGSHRALCAQFRRRWRTNSAISSSIRPSACRRSATRAGRILRLPGIGRRHDGADRRAAFRIAH